MINFLFLPSFAPQVKSSSDAKLKLSLTIFFLIYPAFGVSRRTLKEIPLWYKRPDFILSWFLWKNAVFPIKHFYGAIWCSISIIAQFKITQNLVDQIHRNLQFYNRFFIKVLQLSKCSIKVPRIFFRIHSNQILCQLMD